MRIEGVKTFLIAAHHVFDVLLEVALCYFTPSDHAQPLIDALNERNIKVISCHPFLFRLNEVLFQEVGQRFMNDDAIFVWGSGVTIPLKIDELHTYCSIVCGVNDTFIAVPKQPEQAVYPFVETNLPTTKDIAASIENFWKGPIVEGGRRITTRGYRPKPDLQNKHFFWGSSQEQMTTPLADQPPPKYSEAFLAALQKNVPTQHGDIWIKMELPTEGFEILG